MLVEKRANIILGITILIIGVLYLWQVMLLPKSETLLNSSQSFPLIIGITLVLLSVLLILKEVFFNKGGQEEATEPVRINWFSWIFYTVSTGIYIFVLIPFVGFIVSTLIFIIAMILYFREIKWYTAVVTAGTTMLFIYFIFNQLLNINLP